MPIEYQVLDGGHLVLTRMVGEVGNREFADYAARLTDDPRLERPVRQLCDARGLSSDADLRLVGIREGAREKFGGGEPALSQVAILASRPMVVGLARQFQAYAPDGAASVEIFDRLQPALQWLSAEQHEAEIRGSLGADGAQR